MAGRLPNFLIIGAPKTATSWLSRNLRAQPSVFMPRGELHYFNRNYALGHAWYTAHFDEATQNQIIGEKSATYLASPEVPGRIGALLPNVRLIAQLRNPVERAYSDYCMLLRRGDVGRRIEDYLDPAVGAQDRFIADGEYAKHLSNWFCYFRREQFLILLYDDVKAKPATAFHEITTFLGTQGDLATEFVRPVNVKEEPRLPLAMRRVLAPLKDAVAPLRRRIWFKVVHSALARPFEYPPLTPDLRLKLSDHYRSDISALETLLGRSLPGWRDE